jgi:hypothetical protein
MPMPPTKVWMKMLVVVMLLLVNQPESLKLADCESVFWRRQCRLQKKVGTC